VELYPLDLLVHIINIVVLYVLLRLILFKPVSKFLAARTDRITNQLNEAQSQLAEADSLKREYKQQLETATEQGHDIIRESQIKASEEAKKIILDAQAQAERILSEAQERTEKEKIQALEQMRGEVAQIATDIAERILKREVTAEDNKVLAEAFFEEMRKK